MKTTLLSIGAIATLLLGRLLARGQGTIWPTAGDAASNRRLEDR